MKFSILRRGAGVFTSFAIATSMFAAPAQVILTVVKFRALGAAAERPIYCDATTALVPHSMVSLLGDATDATLCPAGPVDLSIRIESALAGESYNPVGVFFQQKMSVLGHRNDPDGRANFSPAVLTGGSLLVHDSFAKKGPEYCYEFFVVIQRTSDGAIGIIDPGIDHTGDQ